MPMVEREALKAELIELLADGREHHDDELLEVLATRLRLTPEQRSKRHENINRTVFGNELDWAKGALNRERVVLRVRPKVYRLVRDEPSSPKEGKP